MSDLLKINVNDKTEEALSAAFGGLWKEHSKFGTYWFSDAGQCARVKRSERQLSFLLLIGTQCGNGYRAISCPIGDGRYERIYIHRAVCELFNGSSPFVGAHVRHLDCNMLNNAASNLAWGTAAENAMDGVANGKIKKGHRSPYARLTQDQADEARRLRASGYTFKSIGEHFSIARMTAQRICTKEQWQ